MTSKKSISELPEQNNLSLEEVRSIPGFKNFSDEKLKEIIESVKELSLLLNMSPSVDIILKK